ncbi:MAG: P-type conjugative transfer ATPase TrbB [Candidatus Eremiobacteraeota bacterium]|nr:P-type conjugative transfer ATPase TrbB [Candidatus Eremiobacteraeota bacterium]
MEDALPSAERRRFRLHEKLKRELGPTVLDALADPSVVEIILNPDGKLWVDALGSGMQDTGTHMKAAQAESLLGTVAMMLNSVVNAEHPILQAELPLDGSRIGGVLPPVVSSPAFAIRKRAALVYTLADYVRSNILEPAHAEALCDAIRARENILIVGSTGSGKTTFANALLHEISLQARQGERIVVLEDTVELQCVAPNRVELRTSDFVDMTQLLRTTMRLRPDRIVVGEVRGAEALALLKAWNTGHPGGLATVHANNCGGGLVRLEQLIQEANVPPQPRLIADAVNIVVWIAQTSTGRKIKEISRVQGWTEVGYALNAI